MAIQTVGVVGCGLMGSGIAQISAEAGYKTIVREVNPELLAKGKSKIEGFLKKAVEKGKATAEQAAATLGRLSFTTKVEDLAPCDLVVEAIVENMAVKQELWKALDGLCGVKLHVAHLLLSDECQCLVFQTDCLADQ